MSTKSSIKYGDGYHLYSDVMDHEDEPPVYLRLDKVSAELYTYENGVSVTVTIPHSIAVALGLIRPTDKRELSNG